MRRFFIFVTLLGFSSWAIASTEDDLNSLVSRMQTAILTQDKAAYWGLVDASDPVFALEHSRWADDWVKHPVTKLELQFAPLEQSAVEANGNLTWRYQNRDGRDITASYRAVFRKLGSRWLYAGEYWLELSAGKVSVKYAAGSESQARSVLERIPDIAGHVANSLAFQSQATINVKIYASKEGLTQSVGMSWKVFDGWNELGEAIKISSASTSSDVLAHEITHNFAFEHFGAQTFPWWLDEGLAEYVSSRYWDPRDLTFERQTVADWAKSGALQPWENLAILDETPTQLWRFVYSQGLEFVVFLTDTYGQDARNLWLGEISSGKSLTAAAKVVFGTSFEQLDVDFRRWLLADTTNLEPQNCNTFQRWRLVN
jgi:hypothetical protein